MITLPLFSSWLFSLPSCRHDDDDDDRRTTERIDKGGIEWKAKALWPSNPHIINNFNNMTFAGNLLRITIGV